MNTRLTLIHAVTPLHAGTGHAVGAIDLPIARERPTGIPLLPGSSLKGALRARSEGEHKLALFGPETTNASDHAGAVQFADAHLLLLPVRSLWGTFAWVTSPYLVQRFMRETAHLRIDRGTRWKSVRSLAVAAWARPALALAGLGWAGACAWPGACAPGCWPVAAACTS